MSDGEFIDIPIIEIVPGWSPMEITDLDELDDAQIKVNALIAEIEYQIDMHDTRPPPDRDLEWLARAKKALKFKKIAAQCVNNQRAKMKRLKKIQEQKDRDQVLLKVIRNNSTDEQFKQWVELAGLGVAA